MKKIAIYLLVSFLMVSCTETKKEKILNTSSETENSDKDVQKEERIDTNKNVDKQGDNQVLKVKKTDQDDKKKTLSKPINTIKTTLNSSSEIKKETVKKETDSTADIVIPKKISNEINDLKDTAISTPQEIKLEIIESKKEIITKPKIDEGLKTFIKRDYNILGNWSLKQENNQVYLIFHSNFKTKNGPDLKVFLSKQSSSTLNGKNASENAIFLKDLKSNKGEQKYLIPANVNVVDYKCVLIHCLKYDKLWGYGTL